MCEKGALWEEGRKPVSQEAASLPIISFCKKKKRKKKANKLPRWQQVVNLIIFFIQMNRCVQLQHAYFSII